VSGTVNFSIPVPANTFSHVTPGTYQASVDVCHDGCLATTPFTISNANPCTTLSLTGITPSSVLANNLASIISGAITGMKTSPCAFPDGISTGNLVANGAFAIVVHIVTTGDTATFSASIGAGAFANVAAGPHPVFVDVCFNGCDTNTLPFSVLSASPALTISSGNNQAGSENLPLSTALTVSVTGAGGVAVAGVPFTFAIVQRPAGSVGASLSAAITTTGPNGKASTQLT
jgi:hypothetical protein